MSEAWKLQRLAIGKPKKLPPRSPMKDRLVYFPMPPFQS
jgi:hypothetical protein